MTKKHHPISIKHYTLIIFPKLAKFLFKIVLDVINPFLNHSLVSGSLSTGELSGDEVLVGEGEGTLGLEPAAVRVDGRTGEPPGPVGTQPGPAFFTSLQDSSQELQGQLSCAIKNQHGHPKTQQVFETKWPNGPFLALCCFFMASVRSEGKPPILMP